MLPVSFKTRFFLYKEAVDMRKSFDGLYGLVKNELKLDAQSGDVYLFINRRRDRIKILLWDRSGFWILYKRLEQGCFQRLFTEHENQIELKYEELLMLLEGIDFSSVKKRKRYRISA